MELTTAYRTGGPHSPGIVVHIPLSVIPYLGLTDALTNDGHFRAAGFVLLF